jgi:predicted small lipoprotein YifL
MIYDGNNGDERAYRPQRATGGPSHDVLEHSNVGQHIKTIVSLFIVLCLVCSVAACGDKGSSKAPCHKAKIQAERRKCVKDTADDVKKFEESKNALWQKYRHCKEL